MDNYDIKNWRKVKEAIEDAGNTDTYYYKRAVAILAGGDDTLDETPQ